MMVHGVEEIEDGFTFKVIRRHGEELDWEQVFSQAFSLRDDCNTKVEIDER